MHPWPEKWDTNKVIAILGAYKWASGSYIKIKIGAIAFKLCMQYGMQ